jgi:hypothetical protein
MNIEYHLQHSVADVQRQGAGTTYSKYVFNGGILTAFGNLHPDFVVHGLQSARLHPRLVAASAAEQIELQLTRVRGLRDGRAHSCQQVD